MLTPSILYLGYVLYLFLSDLCLVGVQHFFYMYAYIFLGSVLYTVENMMFWIPLVGELFKII